MTDDELYEAFRQAQSNGDHRDFDAWLADNNHLIDPNVGNQPYNEPTYSRDPEPVQYEPEPQQYEPAPEYLYEPQPEYNTWQDPDYAIPAQQAGSAISNMVDAGGDGTSAPMVYVPAPGGPPPPATSLYQPPTTPVPPTGVANPAGWGLDPAQAAAYQQWLNAGGVGSPPAAATQNQALLAQQQQQAGQAVALAQGSPNAGAGMDLTGTVVPQPTPPPPAPTVPPPDPSPLAGPPSQGLVTNAPAPTSVGGGITSLVPTPPPPQATTSVGGSLGALGGYTQPPNTPFVGPVPAVPNLYGNLGNQPTGVVPSAPTGVAPIVPPPTAVLPPYIPGGLATPPTGTPAPTTTTPPANTGTIPSGPGVPAPTTPAPYLGDVSALVASVGGPAGQLMGAGGNNSQVQAGNQTGTLATNTGQASNTNQQTANVGTSNQTTNNTQSSTGTQGTTGTNTTQGLTATQGSDVELGNTTQRQIGVTEGSRSVVDNLGLGGLISGMTGQTGRNDAARSGFLTDVMQNGGTQFESQVDQAVRRSLTGPQTTGAGDSARARMGGYAAAEVARNDMGARLNAAQQLGGPTASGTLVQQAQPLLGERTTGSSESLGNTLSQLAKNSTQIGQSLQAGTNASNTTSANNTTGTSTQAGSNTNVGSNITDMVGGQSTASAASGASQSAAAGQAPTQQSGGGGCYVTSALASQGYCDAEDVRAAVRYKLYQRRSRFMPIGYSVYGPFLAKQVLKKNLVGRLLRPIAIRVLNEELRLAGRSIEFDLGAWALHILFHYGSAALGAVVACFGAKCKTRDHEIAAFLKQNNLYFEV